MTERADPAQRRTPRCPYCHDALSGATWTCPSCHAAYHRACLLEHPGCVTLGCAGRPDPDAASAPAEPRCPYCHDALDGSTWSCPCCRAVHHLDCVREHPECATYGCRGVPSPQTLEAAVQRRPRDEGAGVRALAIPFGCGAVWASWKVAELGFAEHSEAGSVAWFLLASILLGVGVLAFVVAAGWRLD